MAAMSLLLIATILASFGSSRCLHVEDNVFYTLVNRLTLLEEKVQKQESINTDQDDLIRFLSEQNRELLARIREQDSLIGRLQTSRLESDKRFVLDSEGPVAFSAVVAPRVIDHTKPNTAIKFETILAEYGGGYNNDTGIFVAPRTGLYLLSCSMFDHIPTGDHGGVMVHGEIMRNHIVLARVFAHAETTYRDQGANTIITKTKCWSVIGKQTEIMFRYATRRKLRNHRTSAIYECQEFRIKIKIPGLKSVSEKILSFFFVYHILFNHVIPALIQVITERRMSLDGPPKNQQQSSVLNKIGHMVSSIVKDIDLPFWQHNGENFAFYFEYTAHVCNWIMNRSL